MIRLLFSNRSLAASKKGVINRNPVDREYRGRLPGDVNFRGRYPTRPKGERKPRKKFPFLSPAANHHHFVLDELILEEY
jgi:hypothetical protein